MYEVGKSWKNQPLLPTYMLGLALYIRDWCNTISRNYGNYIYLDILKLYKYDRRRLTIRGKKFIIFFKNNLPHLTKNKDILSKPDFLHPSK